MLSLLITSGLSSAAEAPHWAEWDALEGSAGDYSTTVRLPGFPAMSMTSDSRGGGVRVISGASTWLSEATPPGAVYGSSRDHQYVNLRPKADNADSPSTTTYTFEHATPPGGWAFALGDIDADEVTISAVDADGEQVGVSELGFQDVFNYCDADGGPSCDGGVLPVWDPATATLYDPSDDADTHGASGWFQPTAAVKELTFTFRWKSGFPIYQTWFANLTRDISGTVDGPNECVAGTTMRLLGPDGTELDSTTPDADGRYEFLGYTASDGYEVEAVVPADCAFDGTTGDTHRLVKPADLGADDASVDFVLRQISSDTPSPEIPATQGPEVPAVPNTEMSATPSPDDGIQHLPNTGASGNAIAYAVATAMVALTMGIAGLRLARPRRR